MKPEEKEFSKSELFFSSSTGIPKHNKKEYAGIMDMEVFDIFTSAIAENKKVEARGADEKENPFANMIKIENKKKK